MCKFHGGASKRARAAAAENVRLDAARQVALRHAIPVATDPVTAIFDAMATSNGLIEFYSRKISELDERGLVFGITKVEDRRSGPGRAGRDTTWESKPSVWLSLLNDERDRLARLAVDAAKLDLDTRRVRLDEQRTNAIVQVLDGTLTALGVDPEDKFVAAAVRAQLALLPGGTMP